MLSIALTATRRGYKVLFMKRDALNRIKTLAARVDAARDSLDDETHGTAGYRSALNALIEAESAYAVAKMMAGLV